MDLFADIEWTDRGRPQRQAKKNHSSSNGLISLKNNFKPSSPKSEPSKTSNTKKRKPRSSEPSNEKKKPKQKKAKGSIEKTVKLIKEKKDNTTIAKKKDKDVIPKSPKEPKEKLYQPIKKNEYINRKPRKVKHDDIQRCNCSPVDGQPGCIDNSCINRALHIECIHGACTCGDHCMNQRFQKRDYSALSKFKTDKKGYGLIANEMIKSGTFIIEYVGEVVDNAELEKRLSGYSGEKHFYCLTLSNGETIDAGKKGNISRFINHSCNPNCVTQKWQVQGEMRIGLFAKRDILQGDELTFDYQFERVGMKIQKCFCGEPNCAKYLGSRTQEKKELKRMKLMSHQKHVNTLLLDQGDSLRSFPFEPLYQRWYKEKKDIDKHMDDSDEEESSEDKHYNMTTQSNIPVFLSRNANKVRLNYLNMFKELMIEEMHKTVEERAKSKEKHASKRDDFSWLLNVNITKLLSSGAIEFDENEEKKSRRRN